MAKSTTAWWQREVERGQKEATKRIGGSMVYVSKKKINWDLKD